MEKKPLTMQQKYRIFAFSRIISYAVLIFGVMMDGLNTPLTWIGVVMAIGTSVYRVMALRCPECDELIVSHFGIIAKHCDKCGWKLGQEKEISDKTSDQPEA